MNGSKNSPSISPTARPTTWGGVEAAMRHPAARGTIEAASRHLEGLPRVAVEFFMPEFSDHVGDLPVYLRIEE